MCGSLAGKFDRIYRINRMKKKADTQGRGTTSYALSSILLIL
jgi:hypothetical protein